MPAKARFIESFEFKTSPAQKEWLEQEGNRTGETMSAVLRRLIDKEMPPANPWDAVAVGTKEEDEDNGR